MTLAVDPNDPLYFVTVKNIAPAPNKSYLSIFNDEGSGRTIKIVRALAWNNQITTELLGGEIGVLYARIVAQTGGTTRLIVGADANNAPVPLKITVKEGATVTLDNGVSGSTFFDHQLVTDDIHGIGRADGLSALVLNSFLNPLNALSQVQPVTLVESAGLTISQDASTVTKGKISCQIIFALPLVD
jgi:hypothetical protein